MTSADEHHMRRALELARRGHGTTWPNPMVGSVVVRGERVLGEGYHHSAGGPHGEVAALDACTEDPAGATLFATLEPCSHHNRTGPCTQAILSARIARVVVGTMDPNPRVAGTGVRQLRDAGVQVRTGVMARECTDLNEVYFTSRYEGRPHVTLKLATDLFGRTATHTGESQWITGELARAHVHRQRAVAPAIAVGSGTALADDPRLTARVPGGAARQPTRVLLDSQLRIPPAARLFADDGVAVIVYHTDAAPRSALAALPGHVEVVPCGPGPRVDLGRALDDLLRREIVGLLVEGGATLAGALTDAGWVDRVLRYLAPRVIGGDRAPGPLRGDGVERLADARVMAFHDVRRLGNDLLIEARRPLEIPCLPD